MAGPSRFPSAFRANSEQTEQIPGTHPKPSISLSFCATNLLGWLTTRNTLGPYPQYGWDFPEKIPEKFRKDPGNALRAFPGISLESTAGMPQTL